MNYYDFIFLLITIVIIVFTMIGIVLGLFLYFRKADAYALNNLHKTCELQYKHLHSALSYIETTRPNNGPAIVKEHVDNNDEFVSPTRVD